MTASRPPDAAGLRLDWSDVPERARAAVEDRLGSPILSAVSQSAGFSPGVAARLRTEDGRRFFAKAAGPEPNALTPAAHRREARVAAALPEDAPVPRFLFSHDEGEGDWIVVVFEFVEGRNPAVPWRPGELDRTLDALASLSELLTPSPLPPGLVGLVGDWEVICGWHWRKLAEGRPARLDTWSARHLDELAALEAEAPAAAKGGTLLHLDLRADNLLLTPDDRVLVVDWPHARVGASWVDAVFFAPSVAMQGGPPPEELLAHHPHSRRADPDALTAVVAAVAGFFTSEGLQPAPPGLPTLRPFQASQGEVARGWLARRTGWR
ncbi:MAG: aminoglycoside phosphotransferase family protein [Actinomycetota bacterium]|nr:aminoglycoside phosphotransferase family protein [Actinomycetota bacterium]